MAGAIGLVGDFEVTSPRSSVGVTPQPCMERYVR